MGLRAVSRPQSSINDCSGYSTNPVTSSGLHQNGDHFTRLEALRLVQQGKQMVYALAMPDGTVKIGCSAHLHVRARKLGGRIIAFKFGDFTDEKAIHDRLKAHLDHGCEWYRPTPEVMAEVLAMRKEFGISPPLLPNR